MDLDYREFWATRERSGVGFDLVGENKDLEYADIRSKVLRILNRFEYDSYDKTGFFLFYEEGLKSFVIVMALPGERIDSRQNMKLCLKIPQKCKTDGFFECLAFLYKWQTGKKDVPCMDELKDNCMHYGISKNVLKNFMRSWLQSICKLQAETIQVFSSIHPKPYDAVFAGTVAWICYKLLPEGRKQKYSFAWNVPLGKCRGFRILVTEDVQAGRCFDLAEKENCPAKSAEVFMLERIIEEYLHNRGKQFLSTVDRYYISAPGYENMMWNFYYYLLDSREQIPCNINSFYELKQGLEQQMKKGVEKAKGLYAALLHSVVCIELNREDANRILNIYLDFLLRSAEYSNDQMKDFWTLLEKCSCMENEEKYRSIILDYFEQIHKISRSLFFQLVGEGLTQGKDFLLELFAFQKLKSRMDVENWMNCPEHEKICEYSGVKKALMSQLAVHFTQEEGVNEILELVQLGSKIDYKQCVSITEKYLKEGTEKYLSLLDGKGWADYLLERKRLWKSSRPFLIFLTEQYVQLANMLDMPMEQEEVLSMVTVGSIMMEAEERKKKQPFKSGERRYSAKTDQVQRILLRRLCTYYQTCQIEENNVEKFCETMSMLLKWKAGNSVCEPELQRADEIMGEIAYFEAKKRLSVSNLDMILNYQIRQEAKDKERLYRYWLEQIDKNIRDVEDVSYILDVMSESSAELQNYDIAAEAEALYKKMMCLAKEENDIYVMESILKSGESYAKKVDIEKLVSMFWKNRSVEDFAYILKCEQNIWEGQSIFRQYHSNSEEENLYNVYRYYRQIGVTEQLVRDVHELREKADEEIFEEFLLQLLKDWFFSNKRKIEFSDLLNLLMTCWETEEELFDIIETSDFDDEMKEEILEKVEEEFHQNSGDRIKNFYYDIRKKLKEKRKKGERR